MFSLKESDSTPGNSAPAPFLFVIYSCNLKKNSFRLSILLTIVEFKIIRTIHGIPSTSTPARLALRSSRPSLLKVTELQAACASGEREKSEVDQLQLPYHFSLLTHLSLLRSPTLSTLLLLSSLTFWPASCNFETAQY